jgi:IPT/TIG domain-containing protein
MFREFKAGGALVCFLIFLSGCGNNPSPAISGFSPVGATVGTTITITGTNFDVGPVNNVVTFNGTAALVISSTPTQIVTTVPAGATSGPISITVNGASGIYSLTSSTSFTVTP